MQRDYFIYLHERDYFELYIFQEVLQSVSMHFLIDLEEEGLLLTFLAGIEDGLYPKRIIIDLHDWQRVKTCIKRLRRQEQVPLLPILVLRDETEDLPYYQNIELFQRPNNRTDWEILVQKIIE